MSKDQEDMKLRLHAGKFEQRLIDFIIILQILLGLSACIISLVIIPAVIEDYLSSRRSVQIHAMMIYPIGALMVIYALSYLYE